MIDLRAKPFYLKDEDISWVEETLSKMDLPSKVGQLFCPIGMTDDENILKGLVQGVKPGGIMYRPADGASMQKTHKFLQDNSQIPLLISANLEAGGVGIATNGTHFGNQMQVAATDDENVAYRLGLVAAREGRIVGCNWAFAPVVDIDINFRNPITNTRTYGSDPDRVLRMSKAYMKAAHETGLAVSIKHFPGDGVDDRDQHLLTSVNTLTAEEWDKTYGMIYKGLIDEGAQTVMVGHIMLPHYQKALNPNLKDEDLMPATLAPELLNGLLREKLGFNGMIVTDATLMAGFTMAAKREDAVPMAIASGCDMFLFNQDIMEDLEYMMKGIEKGILTIERVDEAVTRILALKAALKLHRQKEEGTLVGQEAELINLKSEEHVKWAKDCADRSVTLVKDSQKLLPLDINKHRRVLLHVLGDTEGLFGGTSCHKQFIELLEKEGFEVTKQNVQNPDFSAMMKPVRDKIKEHDLCMYFSNLETASNQTVVRINWAPPMGIDVPKHIQEMPTIFISVANPYHLQDVPRVKTFINGYTSNEYVLEAIVEKIMGRTEFKGKSPVDPFCGYWDARL